MGSEIKVNPARIAKHGQSVQNEVKDQLQKALTRLNDGGTVEGGDFSVTGTLASVAYPGGLQFAFEDLHTHLDMLDGFAKGIEITAKNYERSERQSIVTA
ncbi:MULTISPECIES: hypothetical protein [Actinomadura]|uniref:WXG100 family type VII secretion target n=1 Tax=Actinomadura yumaensis TaxID=111807 RepID=A0ABW2CHN4_9ACTN|nr:hypothetical protein [Actinomadura sp. J1-007]MWK34533.1 hypothetical protein [Actinomadura sp. J1-007]